MRLPLFFIPPDTALFQRSEIHDLRVLCKGFLKVGILREDVVGHCGQCGADVKHRVGRRCHVHGQCGSVLRTLRGDVHCRNVCCLKRRESADRDCHVEGDIKLAFSAHNGVYALNSAFYAHFFGERNLACRRYSKRKFRTHGIESVFVAIDDIGVCHALDDEAVFVVDVGASGVAPCIRQGTHFDCGRFVVRQRCAAAHALDEVSATVKALVFCGFAFDFRFVGQHKQVGDDFGFRASERLDSDLNLSLNANGVVVRHALKHDFGRFGYGAEFDCVAFEHAVEVELFFERNFKIVLFDLSALGVRHGCVNGKRSVCAAVGCERFERHDRRGQSEHRLDLTAHVLFVVKRNDDGFCAMNVGT